MPRLQQAKPKLGQGLLLECYLLRQACSKFGYRLDILLCALFFYANVRRPHSTGRTLHCNLKQVLVGLGLVVYPFFQYRVITIYGGRNVLSTTTSPCKWCKIPAQRFMSVLLLLVNFANMQQKKVADRCLFQSQIVSAVTRSRPSFLILKLNQLKRPRQSVFPSDPKLGYTQ